VHLTTWARFLLTAIAFGIYALVAPGPLKRADPVVKLDIRREQCEAMARGVRRPIPEDFAGKTGGNVCQSDGIPFAKPAYVIFASIACPRLYGALNPDGEDRMRTFSLVTVVSPTQGARPEHGHHCARERSPELLPVVVIVRFLCRPLSRPDTHMT
jgi:hypothetical protein